MLCWIPRCSFYSILPILLVSWWCLMFRFVFFICFLLVGSSPRWRRSEKNSRFVSDPSCDPSRSAVRRSQGCRLETLQRARCGRCRASSRSWIGQGVRAGEGVQVDEVAAASPSGRPTARCARGRWWNGGAVLAYAQAHPGELASPPPPAQCQIRPDPTRASDRFLFFDSKKAVGRAALSA